TTCGGRSSRNFSAASARWSVALSSRWAVTSASLPSTARQQRATEYVCDPLQIRTRAPHPLIDDPPSLERRPPSRAQCGTRRRGFHPCCTRAGPRCDSYDVTNYLAINPQFGTMADFHRLLREAHARGIKVLIDMVLNHTSD